jgi:hypothetical protein
VFATLLHFRRFATASAPPLDKRARYMGMFTGSRFIIIIFIAIDAAAA